MILLLCGAHIHTVVHIKVKQQGNAAGVTARREKIREIEMGIFLG